MYHKWQSYDVWFLRYQVQHTKFFLILDHSLPCYPPYNPENQNIEKMRNSPGDIIILHKCTINDNHIRNGSWDMECDRRIFVILDYFLPFYPPNNPGNQNIEKMKQLSGHIIVLHMCRYYKWQSYAILFLKYEPLQTEFLCHFGPFFPFYPTNNPIIRILKKWKRLLEITSFYTVVSEIWCMRGRWTDRRTTRKSNI